MPFGQVVVGPPGSGKTTYCHGMQQFLNALGRKTIVVNLDPANGNTPYSSAVNIEDLITLQDAMEEYQLGPNGGMVYCMEYLEKNMGWLGEKLKPFADDEYYFIFDCPGQVELYTHNESIRTIVRRLEKQDYRLACVHLVDASYCTEAAKFISVLLLSLTTMSMLEMPHVNVLAKIDLLGQFGQLDFNLEYYTSVMDLDYLLYHLNEREPSARFGDLNRAICGLIEDFSLVGFSTLCVSDKHSVAMLLKEIDKANGYIFGALTEGNESILLAADSTDALAEARDAQERYGILKDGGIIADDGKTDGARAPQLCAMMDTLKIVEHKEMAPASSK
ncbi:Gpn2 protein [Coemansia reversa NRRL 1564]|uniref:GPN-loop GTPase 2 n=1 Tax=Coemansia reversa (strain ATCC 12441 / NRRL 1564) TaxID=763665 RepID=A0A2G5BIP6_COERN|nr:Gpn2 protein [Coemansia reversa NRRL 1564]|eukprot:PIA18851.1 Gpn2 protein [Coemansia reversa NRRL 1564]